jgi:hypothetical protein
VIIVGSQALLVGRNDIRRDLRMSEEIDVYPGNLHEWEAANPGQEASEVIHALLGEGSAFHESHGFFIDGVDDRTASLPPDWKDRAVRKTVATLDGRNIEALAPEPNDLVAAKLVRGDPKDIAFARLCLKSGLVKHDVIEQRLEILVSPETLSLALGRLKSARHGRTQTTKRARSKAKDAPSR